MLADDQAAVIELLSSPATHRGAAVERIETHTALVFLAGSRAWKLKRAVRFDYVDFSTVERRRAMCEAEVRLNRRTAPDLYRGVVAVTRESDHSLALGGAGTPVDWVVEMNRFDQDLLLDRLAARGALDLTIMQELAASIARFHTSAETCSGYGGAAAMRWVVEGNAEGFSTFGRSFLDGAGCTRVTDASLAEVARLAPVLDARRAGGFVRQCHGDLHLRNIVLLNGQPTLFDAIEFNDGLACIDVFYDLAFLLMDIWQRSLPRHANAVLNRYVADAGDVDGLGLLPLFLSCRAAIRAKTSATAASMQSSPARRDELQARAKAYLAAAEALLRRPQPALIAVGGFSGTGKTTVALAAAPSVGAVPGAVVLRSDEIRKAVCGVRPLDRLGPEGYRAEISARVYATLRERAHRVLRSGHSVIVDAVYARAEDRAAVERMAADVGVPFVGLWLEAPEALLLRRIAERHDDASDADASVVRMQRVQDTGPITWRRIDASGSIDVVLDRALSSLGVGAAT